MPRPEKEIPESATMELAELARNLRALRQSSKLTFKQLAGRSHYSAAALSTAASGKSVPKWEVVEAFVRGCGVTGDLTAWMQLRDNAQARALADEVAGKATVRPEGGVGDPSLEERTEPHQPQRVAPLRKAEPPDQPDGLLALVQQFMDVHLQMEVRHPSEVQRVSSPILDGVHTALALCTTPADVLAVMRQLVAERRLTMGDLEELSDRYYRISAATFDHVLNGTELPTTEWLNIFLRSCSIPQERTLIWHYTVTRIKISSIRHRSTPPPLVPVLGEPEPGAGAAPAPSADRHQPHMWIMMVCCVITTVLAVMQLLHI